jgi:hypothetical protein
MSEYSSLFGPEDEQRLQRDTRAPSSEYSALFNDEDAKLDATVRRSVLVNPDKVTQHKALSQATGVPLPTVERNEEEVAQQKRAGDLKVLLDAHPALRKQFA